MRINSKPLMYSVIFLCLLLLLALMVINSNDFFRAGLYTSILILMINIIYSIMDFKNRFIFLCFNFTFFLFMLGSILISYLKYEDLGVLREFSEQTLNHIVVSVLLSLFTISLLYLFMKDKKNMNVNEILYQSNTTNQKRNIIKSIVLPIWYISFIAKLIIVIERVIILSNTSYYDYYVSFSSSVPSLIHFISSIFYLLTFLYLATLPTKKESIVIITGYLIISILIVSYGERGEPIANLVALIFYIYVRNSLDNDYFKIKKKIVVIILLMLPLIIFGLEKLHFERNNISTNMTINEGIESFFTSQGGSIRVIGIAHDYKENINYLNDSNYVFGPIKSYLTQNIISRSLFGIEPVKQNTIEAAQSGYSLNQALSYLRFPTTFVQGRGMGSNYVAELYHDYNYIGVIIGNVLVVLIILGIEKVGRLNPYTFTLSLLVLQYIILLPRGAMFTWFSQTFAFQNVLSLVVIAAIASKLDKNLSKRGNNK